jgi:hypothetical protein
MNIEKKIAQERRRIVSIDILKMNFF